MLSHPHKGLVIIYVEGGGGGGGGEGEKKAKAISDWLEGGLNVFIKKFWGGGGQQFEVYSTVNTRI